MKRNSWHAKLYRWCYIREKGLGLERLPSNLWAYGWSLFRIFSSVVFAALFVGVILFGAFIAPFLFADQIWAVTPREAPDVGIFLWVVFSWFMVILLSCSVVTHLNERIQNVECLRITWED